MNPEPRGVLGARGKLGAEFAGNMRNRHCLGVPTEKTNKREDHDCFFRFPKIAAFRR